MASVESVRLPHNGQQFWHRVEHRDVQGEQAWHLPTEEECKQLSEKAKALTVAALAGKSSVGGPMYYLTSEEPEERREKPEDEWKIGEARYDSDSVEQLEGHTGGRQQELEEDWSTVGASECLREKGRGRGEQSFYKLTAWR